MNVFIHHEGALGDVVLSLPVIRAIAAGGKTLHFAGRRDVGSLLRETGIIVEASSSGDSRFVPLHAGRADEGARAFLRSFERAVIFTADPASPFVTAVRDVLPGTDVIVTIPPAGMLVPIPQYRLRQFGADLVPGDGPLLPVPKLHQELAAGILSRGGFDGFRPVVAVHPGSGGKTKCWPLDRYLSLLGDLKSRVDPFIIIFSGPAEDDAIKDRIDAFVRGRFGVLHFSDADLIAVAALLRSSDLYLGNDSGVSHLAAAVGCRVIVLFGPTDPALWRPQGPQVEVLWSADLAGVPVAAVYERVSLALGP